MLCLYMTSHSSVFKYVYISTLKNLNELCISYARVSWDTAQEVGHEKWV